MKFRSQLILTVVLASAPAAFGQLQLHLPFDSANTDGGGNLISPDASGFGRNAYLNLAASNAVYGVSGASIVSGARAGGGALQLDGVNDFARVLGWSGLSGSAARTLSLWVKEPASTANPNDIWAGWGDTGGSARVRWDFGLANSSAAGMRLELNSGFASFSGATIGDDAWHMVTVTYAAAATGLSFYLDGNLYGTATFSSGAPNTITTGNLGIAIGAGIREVAAANGNAARFVNGLIDDLRIYDTELTAGDVQTLYLTTVPEPSAVALFGLGGLALLLRRPRRH
jgi:hypothetical protein